MVSKTFDSDSRFYHQLLLEKQKLIQNRFDGVKSVLIVLSARGMTLDPYSLMQKIEFTYPGAEVYLESTSGVPLKTGPCTKRVDLLIDFTGPKQFQRWFSSLRFKNRARYRVGRNAGFFRKWVYDRVFDEKDPQKKIPRDMLERERLVQKEVLALAGIPVIPMGTTTQDLSKEIALGLPPLQKSH